MKKIQLSILIITVILTGAAYAQKTVYFRSGHFTKCESYWEQGDEFHLRLNDITINTFPKEMIDIEKTNKANKEAEQEKKAGDPSDTEIKKDDYSGPASAPEAKGFYEEAWKAHAGKEPAKMKPLLEHASSLGHVKASFDLAECYNWGDATMGCDKPDKEKALEYYLLGIKQNGGTVDDSTRKYFKDLEDMIKKKKKGDTLTIKK